MKCKVLHRSKNRIRVHMFYRNMTLDEADVVEYYFRDIPEVKNVEVFDRTSDVIVEYRGNEKAIIDAFSSFQMAEARERNLVPQHTTRTLNREYENKLVNTICAHYFKKFFFPLPIRNILTVINSIKYIGLGLKALFTNGLTVPVLDGTAVTVSMLQGNFSTSSSVMFMLKIGEIMEEWTHKKSVADLAGAMSLHIDKVWLKTEDTEVLVNITDIVEGDKLVIRTGNMIPLDAKVVDGEASVNQASITGESLPIVKKAGSYVYAGTVVEEGECIIQVDKLSGNSKYDRIMKMIEDTEKLKSVSEDHASKLADHLVPYTFATTALTYLFTRNVTKALAVLMVDFSCALKLSIPIAVLSAMREGNRYDMSIKGGKFLETVAKANTIVFDKTGTLTFATPKVAQIVTFNGNEEDEMLRLAACLEEHYPHSIANAVVQEAKDRGLTHDEYHSKVEYVVAHGIMSKVNDQKVVIGSYHFVFEDEKCEIPEAEMDKFNAISSEYSQLYLAISGKLSAVICISDPVRPEAKAAIEALHKLGIDKIVMMTGDNKRTAEAVANLVGVDEYHAEVLPDDKANYVLKEKEEGRTVIMIGDGINDSPALSAADVGIAINTGAAIAREIADITISSSDLFELVTLRELSEKLIERINLNYRTIISFNSLLILGGILGVLQPTTSALLHNASTLLISTKSMTNLLDEDKEATQNLQIA